MLDAEQFDDAVLAFTTELISRVSVTPEDAGCQDLIAARLEAAGFSVEWIDAGDVRNLWATRKFDDSGPHLLLAGHTDVVPSGPEADWSTPPFAPTVKDNRLYGRGAADMKTSLAAMVVAVEHLVTSATTLTGTLSFLLTSDEEGEAVHGTRHAVEVLNERGIRPDYCVVGEPSSSHQIGDVVRCGRRGSLNAKLTVRGVQGHVAYPQDANNPIHGALTALGELTDMRWDEGNEYYPPTSLQISNVNAGTGATNVIPGSLEVLFNLRFNTLQTSSGIQATVAALLDRHELDYDLDWQLSGEPFLTERGALTAAVCAAIEHETGRQPELSTSGGTSDGRFISPWCVPGSNQVEVVELGPSNATIHKVNECIDLTEMGPLTRIYAHIVLDLLQKPAGAVS